MLDKRAESDGLNQVVQHGMAPPGGVEFYMRQHLKHRQVVIAART